MAKQSEVEVGHVWSAKISGRLVHCRVTAVHKPDNWRTGRSYKTKYSLLNLRTQRQVGPYAATKLRIRHRHLEAANSSNL